MNKHNFITPVVLLLMSRLAAAEPSLGDFAEPHPQLDNMIVLNADLDEMGTSTGSIPHFKQPIPKIIHQVWFGNPEIFDDERANDWQMIAEQFGYDYHLWTENDDAELAGIFGAETVRFIDDLRQKKRFAAASDVLRYHLLEHFGGMYFDNDVPGPRRHGQLLDPATLWPLEGLVLVSENDTREVHNSAFYAINAIMMAPPHHPVITALTDSLLVNRDAQPTALSYWGATGPIFVTGQALLTATVRGPFTFLPYGYLDALNMKCWPDRGPYERSLKEQFRKRSEQPERMESIHRRHQTPAQN